MLLQSFIRLDASDAHETIGTLKPDVRDPTRVTLGKELDGQPR